MRDDQWMQQLVSLILHSRMPGIGPADLSCDRAPHILLGRSFTWCRLRYLSPTFAVVSNGTERYNKSYGDPPFLSHSPTASIPVALQNNALRQILSSLCRPAHLRIGTGPYLTEGLGKMTIQWLPGLLGPSLQLYRHTSSHTSSQTMAKASSLTGEDIQ